ncbi:MAG: autotransporter outer membrane beta-barrel domain-containing protein, partial [Akkermansiaceae bacterium]|nr:autotransporter outer membrane beta-barrel domain-containing protein [Akkermansiaceae bacterium]
ELGDHAASKAMISFVEGKAATLEFAAPLLLEFDAEDLFDLQNEQGLVSFRIWLTNGSVSGDAIDFTFGSGWNSIFFAMTSPKLADGWVEVAGDLSGVWFASEHTTGGEITGVQPGVYEKVVVNADTHLQLTAAGTTLRYLEGTAELRLDGEGTAELRNDQAATRYEGRLVAEKGVKLYKTGASELTMVGNLTADALTVEEESGAFIIGAGSQSRIGALEGEVRVEGELTLTRGSAGSAVVNEGSLVLLGAASGETQQGRVSMGSKAALELRAGSDAAAAQAGANVHLSEGIAFRKDTTTTLTFNMASDALWNRGAGLMLTSDGALIIEEGASFVVNTLQSALPSGQKGKDLVDVVVMRGASLRVVEEYAEEMLRLAPAAAGAEERQLAVRAGGIFRLFNEGVTLRTKGNEVLLSATYVPESVLPEAAQGSSGNAQAGAGLIGGVGEEKLAEDETLSKVASALGDMLAAGQSREAARVMAAVAGSTVTTLSAAQRDSLRYEMLRLRRHAAAQQPAPAAAKEARYRVVSTAKEAASERGVAAAGTWLHAWVEGTAGRQKRHTQGDAAGYSLTSWGGAAGADMALTNTLSVGIAMSAQYGDLKASAADTASGDLDSYYLSAYAQYKPSRWGHTLLITGSRSEATLNRTVDYGQGSYSTHGSTAGGGIGAYYEVARDIKLSGRSGRLNLQPYAGASLVYTELGGYSESGADGAGLNVGRQRQTLPTLALGARMKGEVGERLLGRSAYGELRVNVAEDLREDSRAAEVALRANPANTRRVNGGGIGRTALQVGAGLSVPLNSTSHAYVQGQAEFREHASGWNVTAGLQRAF